MTGRPLVASRPSALQRLVGRTVTHHHRTGDRIDTRIIANEPINMDPPGIIITVEEIYGAA